MDADPAPLEQRLFPFVFVDEPRALPRVPSAVYAYVDDVDAHCARARAAGAAIETEPEDKHWGDRLYAARDPEGHVWYFASRSARAGAQPGVP